MRAGIVVFPGTNRERDMAIALERSTGAKAADGVARRDRRCRRST